MKRPGSLKASAAEGRPGRGLRKRWGCLLAAVVAAAALLYYGAVWLMIERVKTMPEGPPVKEIGRGDVRPPAGNEERLE